MTALIRPGRKRRRARDGDLAAYSPRTIESYNCYIKPYERYAADSGFDARYPTPEQMRTYFLDINESENGGRRHKSFSALGAFFRMHNAPNVMEHPIVLETMEDLRTQSTDPRDLRIGHLRRRAQSYAYDALSEKVRKQYERVEKRWIAFADEKGFDPRHPHNDHVIAYLDKKAVDRAYKTVASEANGLRAFFRRNELPDLMDEEPILARLDKLRRDCKPPKPRPPVAATALIPGLAKLDPSTPLDARDGLAGLLAALAGVYGAQAQRLDRSRIKEVDEGVLFFTDIPRRREIFIGKPTIAELDIRPWLRSWLKHVGTDPGPLFPHISQRGKVCDYPIEVTTLRKAIHRVARLCGEGITKVVGMQLKKSFIVKVTRKHGPAVAIQSVGYASESSLERHTAFLGSSYRRRQIANNRRRRRFSAPPMGRTPIAPRARTQAPRPEGASDA